MTFIVQVHESELVHELTRKRIEAEIAEKARSAAAVSEAEVRDASRFLYYRLLIFLFQRVITNKTSDLLTILRLRSLIAAAGVDSVPEGAAIFAAAEILLGEDEEAKLVVLNGFLTGEGEFESVPCKLLT
jgi:hypothetical protein